MFEIIFRSQAIRRIRKMKRYDAVAILDGIERHLREEPEKITRSSIKRLRGEQDTTFRLRVKEYRVFYDVVENRVEIVQILHKSETQYYYHKENINENSDDL